MFMIFFWYIDLIQILTQIKLGITRKHGRNYKKIVFREIFEKQYPCAFRKQVLSILKNI